MCYIAITGSSPSYLSELLTAPLHAFPLSPLFEQLELQCFKGKFRGFRTFSHFGPPHLKTISLQTSGTLLLSLPSTASSRQFSSVFHPYQTVCVCVCVCILHPCWYVHYVLAVKLRITFSISMYISVLFLFSALSRGDRRFTNFHYYHYYLLFLYLK